MKKGFTLIELLIVITIIGILAVAFLPQLLGAPSKARDTQRVADLQRIAGVLTQYSVNSSLPASGCVTAALAGIDEADFGGSVPTDPDPANVNPGTADCTGQYAYVKDPNDAGTTVDAGTFGFGVYANVENFENANAVCADAINGFITAPVEGANPTADDELCYAILVQ